MAAADEDPVVAEYEDATGHQRVVDPATVERLRRLVGTPDRRPDEDVLVLGRGDRHRSLVGQLTLEDGGELAVLGSLADDVPFGYHRLHTADDRELAVIVSPRRCYAPAQRSWGWAAQLYAARSRSSWGIGDLADLAALTTWSAGLGAGFVMINPLHAAAPGRPQQPSPYSPTSRRFLNPLYLRIEDVPGADRLGDDLGALAGMGRALNDERIIDRDAVFALKMDALERIWRLRPRPAAAELDAWRTAQPAALVEFATWTAIAERHGPSWRHWPTELRRPDSPAVQRFTAGHADRVDFQVWLQWLLHRQVYRASATIDVIQDLPIGFDRDGADSWSWQDELALDVSIGAPPDEFSSTGQDWGLPPFVPWKLRQAAYRPFVETVRATIAGGLRIDHVMGLFRLWWIPPDADARGGAYVRYPADDLLDIVALESHRAGAVVVGEDLGTVEPGVRQRLAERNVLSYKVLWFEEEPASTWPAAAMATVTTHDLPTVVGMWDGTDLAAQDELGLQPNVESTLEIRTRLADRGGLADDAEPVGAVIAAHRLLAEAPCALAAATLDDALAVADRPNMPGADGQRQNWCFALPVPIDELDDQPLVRTIADRLNRAVNG